MKTGSENIFLKTGLETIMRFWEPESSPKAVVVGIHGFAEHSGRYSHFGEFLVEKGIALYMYDLRGHGLSKSERGYINSFEDFIRDTIAFVEHVKSKTDVKSFFIFGHSMGGLIATHTVSRLGDESRGFITSGAAVEVRTPLIQKILLQLLGVFSPRKRIPLPVATDCLTRDEDIIKRYVDDPLVLKDPTVKLLVEFGKGVASVWSRVPLIKVPALIMHGEEDCLVPPSASRKLYESISSKDKTLKVYKGLRHEILNEPEWRQIASEIADWIAKHA
jgi:alpha-beta hydrolase superfamily lysophospholipase